MRTFNSTLFYKSSTVSLFFLLIILSCNPTSSQTGRHTANDFVPTYNGHFGYGSNMGYYGPYNDMQIADIAAKIGVNCMRPALFEHFLETWGYDIRTDVFQHFGDLGMTQNVLFLGYPSTAHRDNTVYCGQDSSLLFANMYEPIWDNGENGTPVNENNFYAAYVYKIVKKYGKNVKFYEIWNEPDNATTYTTLQPPGTPGSWWTTNPDPCDYALRAPVQHYIRLLRISYEVIKSLDSTAYVCIGGIGFPSFLDVVLRQTDNPMDGSVTKDFPLYGGAYFDVLSYHAYPHIDNSLREWNNNILGFNYFRHSDRAVTGLFNEKNKMTEVLKKFGYDGTTYPGKCFIITETNIPSKQIGTFIGSYEAQRNYVMKALVKAQQNGVCQLHVYSIGEVKADSLIHDEFDKMGLYPSLSNTVPYEILPNESGYGFATTSNTLSGFDYDATETKRLLIPEDMDGGAFRNTTSGEVRYVLWAKTSLDQSGKAEAIYNFPEALDFTFIKRREWDFSKTQKETWVSWRNVQLSGTPTFFLMGAK